MTIRTVTKFETRLRSPRSLADAMAYRRHTVRSLRDAVNRELKRQRKGSVSVGTIGNLRSGAAKYARCEVARAIEEILDVAPGALFDARVSNVGTEGPKNQVGAVAPILGAVLMLAFGAVFVVAIYLGMGWFQTEAAQLSEVAGQWIGAVL